MIELYNSIQSPLEGLLKSSFSSLSMETSRLTDFWNTWTGNGDIMVNNVGLTFISQIKIKGKQVKLLLSY